MHSVTALGQAGNSMSGPTPDVSNITSSQPSEFPFLLQLKFNNSEFCGAVLISTILALTAASCFKDKIPRDITMATKNVAVNMSIQEVIVHENLMYGVRGNDIAIIVLNEEFPINGWTQSIYFPRITETKLTGQAFAIGWGSAHECRAGTSKELRKHNIHIISSENCSGVYIDANQQRTIDTNNVCAKGVPDNFWNALPGAPLVCIGEDGHNYLCGIVSRIKCADFGLPIVCTNVTRYSDWISSQIIKLRKNGTCSKPGMCDLINPGKNQLVVKSHTSTPSSYLTTDTMIAKGALTIRATTIEVPPEQNTSAFRTAASSTIDDMGTERSFVVTTAISSSTVDSATAVVTNIFASTVQYNQTLPPLTDGLASLYAQALEERSSSSPNENPSTAPPKPPVSTMTVKEFSELSPPLIETVTASPTIENGKAFLSSKNRVVLPDIAKAAPLPAMKGKKVLNATKKTTPMSTVTTPLSELLTVVSIITTPLPPSKNERTSAPPTVNDTLATPQTTENKLSMVQQFAVENVPITSQSSAKVTTSGLHAIENGTSASLPHENATAASISKYDSEFWSTKSRGIPPETENTIITLQTAEITSVLQTTPNNTKMPTISTTLLDSLLVSVVSTTTAPLPPSKNASTNVPPTVNATLALSATENTLYKVPQLAVENVSITSQSSAKVTPSGLHAIENETSASLARENTTAAPTSKYGSGFSSTKSTSIPSETENTTTVPSTESTTALQTTQNANTMPATGTKLSHSLTVVSTTTAPLPASENASTSVPPTVNATLAPLATETTLSMVPQFGVENVPMNSLSLLNVKPPGLHAIDNGASGTLPHENATAAPLTKYGSGFSSTKGRDFPPETENTTTLQPIESIAILRTTENTTTVPTIGTKLSDSPTVVSTTTASFPPFKNASTSVQPTLNATFAPPATENTLSMVPNFAVENLPITSQFRVKVTPSEMHAIENGSSAALPHENATAAPATKYGSGCPTTKSRGIPSETENTTALLSNGSTTVVQTTQTITTMPKTGTTLSDSLTVVGRATAPLPAAMNTITSVQPTVNATLAHLATEATLPMIQQFSVENVPMTSQSSVKVTQPGLNAIENGVSGTLPQKDATIAPLTKYGSGFSSTKSRDIPSETENTTTLQPTESTTILQTTPNTTTVPTRSSDVKTSAPQAVFQQYVIVVSLIIVFLLLTLIFMTCWFNLCQNSGTSNENMYPCSRMAMQV